MHRTQTGFREGWRRACQGPSDATHTHTGSGVGPCPMNHSHMAVQSGFVCSQST